MSINLSSNHESILDQFLAIEKNLDLFIQKELNIHYWELIRYELFNELLAKKNLHAQNVVKQNYNICWLKRYFSFLLKSLTFKSPIRAKRNSIIIIGHSRKKLEGGSFLDIYSDSFLQFLTVGTNVHVFEKSFRAGFHFEPSVNQNVLHLDGITEISRFWHAITRNKLSLQTSGICQKARFLFNEKMGVDLDIPNKAKKAISIFRKEVVLYKWLFQIVRPKAVFIVVSSHNKSIIVAAKVLGIPTAELQHGSPAKGKLNYDYPAGVPGSMFPDYFLSFGRRWTESVNLPVKTKNVIPIGFPYLELMQNKYRNITKKEQLVIISQPKIANLLIDFTKKLAENKEKDYKIVYKIHPQESDLLTNEYEELKQLGVNILSGSSTDLYKVLAESKWQIGVYSTALYEGMTFSCITLIFMAPGWEYMKSILDSNLATLIKSPEEFLDVKTHLNCPTDGCSLFQNVTHNHVNEVINKIVRN